MGSGASAATYDPDQACVVFQPPPDVVAAASISDSTVALAKLEELANITCYPFPREGLTFALSARELQRTEEDGDTLKDAIGGKEVCPEGSSVTNEQMVRAWEGPVRVNGGIQLDGSAFTIALWIRVLEGVGAETVAIASGSSAKGLFNLLSLEERGCGLSVSETSPVATDGQRDIWQLLLLQGEGLRHVSLAGCGHRRSWMGSAADLFVASDRRMVRPLARDVRCKQPCSRLEVFGGPGVAIAEAFVWSRCLTEGEREAVFIRGAITYGSTAMRTLGWSLLAGEVPPEDLLLSKFQEDIAGMEGIADLTCGAVTDGDLPTVLAALLANSTLHTVILSENALTVSSGPALLDFLDSWAKPAFVLDLQRCKDLGNASFEAELLEVFEDVRGMGVKVLAQGTGLSEMAVQMLANDTPEALAAAEEREEAIAATQEVTRTFMAYQAQLAAMWALEDEDAEGVPTTNMLERVQELRPANGVQLLPPALAAIAQAALIGAGARVRVVTPFASSAEIDLAHFQSYVDDRMAWNVQMEAGRIGKVVEIKGSYAIVWFEQEEEGHLWVAMHEMQFGNLYTFKGLLAEEVKKDISVEAREAIQGTHQENGESLLPVATRGTIDNVNELGDAVISVWGGEELVVVNSVDFDKLEFARVVVGERVRVLTPFDPYQFNPHIENFPLEAGQLGRVIEDDSEVGWGYRSRSAVVKLKDSDRDRVEVSLAQFRNLLIFKGLLAEEVKKGMKVEARDVIQGAFQKQERHETSALPVVPAATRGRIVDVDESGDAVISFDNQEEDDLVVVKSADFHKLEEEEEEDMEVNGARRRVRDYDNDQHDRTEVSVLRAMEAKRKYEEYLQKQKGAKQVLKKASESYYSEKFQSERPDKWRGSGMLMAHFGYIGGAVSVAGLRQPSFFGLLHRQDQPRKKHRSGAVDFQTAVPEGVLSIVSATGHSFGQSALHLTVRNPGRGRITVVLSSGTIFEHIDWVHKQNLMVISSVVLELWPNEQKQVSVDAHCMNLSCSCSAGENMYLTDFYFNDAATIAHQGKVWDYFQGKFRACSR